MHRPPNEPRNVTPESDDFRRRAVRERDEGPEWRAWTWASGGTGFPLLGVLLVLIGVALLVQFFFPAISAGTVILLAIGVAFLAAWVLGRSWFSMVPGVLVVALGLSELIEDFGVLGPPREDVPGLAASALALGFLAVWAIANASGRSWRWPLWGVAIFGLIGIAGLSRLITIPLLGVLLPVVIIVAGIALLLNARRSWRARRN
ncbi:MAG: hypothetical protein M3N29_10090 [Chloroflexota bacterium]|nr:hypothetical protein [Chloroflexota bacterium]